MEKSTLFQKILCTTGLKIVNHLNSRMWRVLFVTSIKKRLKQLSPSEGLRFLFGIEEELYPLEGKLAIAYDKGIHTKHRHIGYHSFFVNRIGSAKRVLDVGCGNGALSYDIATKVNVDVVGVDFSKENIAAARRNYSHPKICYRLTDVRDALPEEHFDVVILSNVLEHISERVQLLKKIKDSVKPNRILIRVPLYERDWRVPLKQELGMEWKLDKTHKTEYTLEIFSNELNTSGLKLIYQEVRWGEIWAETVIPSLKESSAKKRIFK